MKKNTLLRPLHKNGRRSLPSDLVRADIGEVSGKIFVDPDLYRLEQERVFGKAWLFVAHESEIPKAGDFVTRKMGEDPVIVWRGQDGKVRVFLNVCRHRGRKVCGEDLGCAAQFQCPYHGWTYSNKGELIAVPFYEGYQGRLDKGELGLYEAPRVESYGGMVFASWEKGKGSLGEYLGEMKWVMDLMFRRSDGMEVVGSPMRWEVDANWKLGAANFAGDGTHVYTTHGFEPALGLRTMRGRSEKERPANYVFVTGEGHSATLVSAPADEPARPYLALPKTLWPQVESRLSREQLDLLRPLVSVVGNLFPNLSFLCNAKQPVPGGAGELVSFFTLRQWQPTAPDRMEVWSWCLVDRDAPEEWKKASFLCYTRLFGAAGMFEQDDLENWSEITQALRGPIARRLRLQFKLGLTMTPARDWPGPGMAYRQSTPVDFSERSFYRRWQERIARNGAF